jgi:S-adenosylmethionine-diacylglycerol 3-amino-3-carboxypropyl transferase
VPSPLPGRVQHEVLGRWHYDAERSLELGAKDRAAIYGGFHRYVFQG